MKPDWHRILHGLFFVVLCVFAAGCHASTPALISPVISGCVVPSLESLPADEAAEILGEMGFTTQVSEVTSADFPAGALVATDPAAGTALSSCQVEILLLVSKAASTTHSAWEGWSSGWVAVGKGSALDLRQEGDHYRWVPQPDSDPIYHYELMPDVALAGDFSFSVEAQRESGGDGSASGLIVYFPEQDRYFLFSLFDVGYFALDEGRGETRTVLVEPKQVDSAYPNDTNLLQVKRHEERYDFYVNNSLVYQLDGHVTAGAAGSVGLAVRLKDAQTVFSFYNPRLDTVQASDQPEQRSTEQYLYDFDTDLTGELVLKTFGAGTGLLTQTDGAMHWALDAEAPTRYATLFSEGETLLAQDLLGLSLDAKRLTGSPGGCQYGIVFNYKSLTGTYQFVSIRDDNRCEVYQYSSITRMGQLLAKQQNCHVKPGKDNNLRLAIRPDALQVFVNGYQVFDLDDSLNGNQLEGSVGIQATCDPGQYLFAFDNFQISHE